MLPAGYKLEEFEVKSKLGAGGFGITYLCSDHKMSGDVAIKEFFPEDYAERLADGIQVVPKSDPESEAVFRWGYEQFIEEARLLSRLRHPNIVQVKRFVEANNTIYMVMEYLKGQSLADVIRQEAPMAQARWQEWMFSLMDGLQQLHKRDLLHRDIKPDNIIISMDDAGDQTPVLIDFGAARPKTTPQSGKANTTLFSECYAPIEQRLDHSSLPQGPFTDIYALACVSYEALTKAKPQDAPLRKTIDEMVSLTQHPNAQGDPAFLAGIDWGLQLNGEDRPQTIEQWIETLKGDKEVLLPPPPPPPKPGLKPLLPIAAALLLVLGGAGVYFFTSDAGPQPGQSTLDRRLGACRSIDGQTQTTSALRCYQRVLEAYPDNQLAQTNVASLFENLAVSARQRIRAGEFAAATQAINESEGIGMQADQVQSLRNAMADELARRASAALAANDLDGSEQWINQLEEHAGPVPQVTELRSALESARAQQQEQEAALVAQTEAINACRVYMDPTVAEYAKAHECLVELQGTYPSARNELPKVERALTQHIDRALTAVDVNSAKALVQQGKTIGMDTTAQETRIQALEERLAQEAEIEKRKQRDREIRLARERDQQRLTYGLQLAGNFEDGRRTTFLVRGTQTGVQALRLKDGDSIEKVNNKFIPNVSRLKQDVKDGATLAEDFSNGVPDSRAMEELIIRPLDNLDGKMRITLRRSGTRVNIFCENTGNDFRCR